MANEIRYIVVKQSDGWTMTWTRDQSMGYADPADARAERDRLNREQPVKLSPRAQAQKDISDGKTTIILPINADRIAENLERKLAQESQDDAEF